MRIRGALLAWCAVLLVAPGVSAAVRLGAVHSGCTTVGQYERCELTVDVAGRIRNPFDPEEVALEATFRPPQGEPVTVQGFYYQPYELMEEQGRETIREAGSPVWKVRFTPRHTGRWTVEVALASGTDRQVKRLEPFLVVEAPNRGFVRLHRERKQFTFDNGEPFVPIGENLCWGPSAQLLPSYRQWFRDLSRQQANYIRLWMAPWALRLETKETGVGRYDQLRAWQLDYLLEQSEAAGLYWQLCLLNHGSFSRSQDPDWQNNPYNEQLGGMCRLPNDFMTHSSAKEMFQRMLRYIVSRWGYSPNLVMWELFNEADFGEFRTEDMVPWFKQMSEYLRSIDVQQRPITTSFHQDGPDAVWQLPAIDTIQLHVYDRRDFPDLFGGPLISRWEGKFQKPVMVGEFGWIGETMRKVDDIGIHLHDGLWSSLMGGAAGTALIWYWDTYVHPNRLERHMRPVAAYWRGEQAGQPLARLNVSLSDDHLGAWGLGGPARAYFWVKNRTHNVDQYLAYRCAVAKQRLRQARGETVDPLPPYQPRPVKDSTATIRGLNWLGRYRVEWWDPYQGRITGRSVERTQWGTLTLRVPDLGFDVAAKLVRLEWWEQG